MSTDDLLLRLAESLDLEVPMRCSTLVDRWKHGDYALGNESTSLVYSILLYQLHPGLESVFKNHLWSSSEYGMESFASANPTRSIIGYPTESSTSPVLV